MLDTNLPDFSLPTQILFQYSLNGSPFPTILFIQFLKHDSNSACSTWICWSADQMVIYIKYMILKLCMSNLRLRRHILEQMLFFVFWIFHMLSKDTGVWKENYKIFKCITFVVVLFTSENSRITIQIHLDLTRVLRPPLMIFVVQQMAHVYNK